MVLSMINKSIPELNELYKEIILEHYRNPCGRVPLEKVHYHADGMNPLCGDEVKLSVQLNVDNVDKEDNVDRIEKVHIEGHGCSISVASGSMLADILKGKTIEEAKQISKSFKQSMHTTQHSALSTQNSPLPIPHFDLGDLEALEGVKKFPVRIKCALLPWTTFDEALTGHEHVEIS